MKHNELERNLCSFDLQERTMALRELRAALDGGKLERAPGGEAVNMHCHTFFSYNGYNFSPSQIAWWAAQSGLFAAGIVDFDVLDGIDEFNEACSTMNLRGAAGVETRVFIPELAASEINSPGEPGISYHMGMGFVASLPPRGQADFAAGLRRRAADRTRAIVNAVNAHLGMVELDYEADVLPLTPAGNATERHVCAAYYAKAEEVLTDESERANFWADKLGMGVEEARKSQTDPVAMQGVIRSKLMKSGGVGYMPPKPENFPSLKEMNEFILGCGAIPVITWLNGESAGEAALEELLDLHQEHGGAAVNIIPDRNWNFADAKVREAKVAELRRFIEAAKQRQLPIIVGTEMNAPGLKMVDDFNADALRPYLADFVDGAALVYAHSILQRQKKGYLSDWAKRKFPDLRARNQYFVELGRQFPPNELAKQKFDD